MPAGFFATVGCQKLSSLLIAHQLERKAGIAGIGRILPGTLFHNTNFRDENNAHIGDITLLCQL